MKYHFLSKHPVYQAFFLFVAVGSLLDVLMFASNFVLYSTYSPWEFHVFPLAAILMTGLSADVGDNSVVYRFFNIQIKKSKWSSIQWFPEGKKFIRAIATPVSRKKAVMLPLLMKQKG